MNDNPFLSKLFISTWLYHFKLKATTYTFGSFPGISFTKNALFPLYYNTGATHTKGFAYHTQQTSNFPKNKVFLIYDVPSYNNIIAQNNVKCITVRQYPGYLIDFAKYSTAEEYLNTTISKNSLKKYYRYQNRLEYCFPIKYRMLTGSISQTYYNYIFDCFKLILEKRFKEKKIRNNNLDKKEWDFYQDISYKLMLQNKASLFVVFNEETPIAISLHYYSNNKIYDVIRSFDIDYAKFHLGTISLLKLVEWCFTNNISSLDFSKGDFDYKRSWSTEQYQFNYHILYDRKSVIASLIAWQLKIKYKSKQWLREKGLNTTLHKINYSIKGNNTGVERILNVEYLQNIPNLEECIEIATVDKHYSFLQKTINEFLFLNVEKRKEVKVLKDKQNTNTFFVIGKKASCSIKCLTT